MRPYFPSPQGREMGTFDYARGQRGSLDSPMALCYIYRLLQVGDSQSRVAVKVYIDEGVSL